MADLIRALAQWAKLWFRRPAAPVGPAPSLVRSTQYQRPWPPTPRSPYGIGGPLDGDETPLVRPYLRDHEERARQRRRRLAMVLAADFGIDLDTHLVGARGVA